MSELYELPNGWEWRKLGSLSTTTSGGTPKRNEKSYWKGNIGWLKSGELNDGYINKVEELITDEGLKKSSAKLFPKGTLLIAMYGATVGKLGILDIETTTNQAICGILNDKKMFITKYMFYYLKSIKEKMLIDSFGGAQPNLSQTYIKDIDTPLPPLSVQQRIVSKLDLLFKKIDKSIELHQKNMDEANTFMGSVLNEVFGELEEKYENKKINEVVKEGGKTISTLDYPNLIYFSLEDIEAHSGKILKYQTASEANVKGTAVRFDSDCVLYSKLRPYLNKVTISKSEGCSTTELVVLRPKEDLDKYFLVSFLRSPNVVNFLHNDSMGAKMPRTNMKTFREMTLPIPPLPIQHKVVEYLDSVSEKMEKVKSIQKEKMESLKALKASILDKAFRGEL